MRSPFNKVWFEATRRTSLKVEANPLRAARTETKAMLRSLYVMLDYHLAAKDGIQGRVEDFLIDDESWVVHYLVAKTQARTGPKTVLIPPFVTGHPDWTLKQVPVVLTCGEILKSPPLERDMPVSLQRESGLKRPGSHLRSMREVLGYSIYTPEGEAGSVEDFIVEDTLWGVHCLVVELRRPSSRGILVSPQSIRSISWPGKAAWVNLSHHDLLNCPRYDPAAPVNHAPDHRLFDYYGRPIHSPHA
jgi:hypothetical protein